MLDFSFTGSGLGFKWSISNEKERRTTNQNSELDKRDDSKHNPTQPNLTMCSHDNLAKRNKPKKSQPANITKPNNLVQPAIRNYFDMVAKLNKPRKSKPFPLLT